VDVQDIDYLSNVAFGIKKDGRMQVCINFKPLNAITRKWLYPFPNMTELLDSLGGSSIFSTLDAALGYWQVQIAEDSVAKTGFITKYSTYEYLHMPFGLTTATSTFEQLMEKVLSSAGLLRVCVLVFVDDIMVYLQNVKDMHYI
jgi:hypothetical protein